MFGGEAASVDAARRLWSSPGRPTHLYNVYGPTENTTYSTFHPIESLPEPGVPIPIGKAIRGTTCYVVDEHLHRVPPGTAGEIVVGGLGVARGYLRRPDRNYPEPLSSNCLSHKGIEPFSFFRSRHV